MFPFCLLHNPCCLSPRILLLPSLPSPPSSPSTGKGFAKLAIEYGYTIVPFASYGTEDMVDVMFDIPLTGILGREMFLPIVLPPTPGKLQVPFLLLSRSSQTIH